MRGPLSPGNQLKSLPVGSGRFNAAELFACLLVCIHTDTDSEGLQVDFGVSWPV